MMKLILDYPNREQEDSIIQLMTGENVPEVRQITSAQEILAFRQETKKIFVDERIRKYILDLVFATRYPAEYGFEDLQGMIAFGASPRASIYFVQASRVLAFLRERDFVSPDDIKQLAPDILRHRVIMTYEAEALGLTPDLIIQRILDETEIL
jgi:MoxR-like ATPase